MTELEDQLRRSLAELQLDGSGLIRRMIDEGRAPQGADDYAELKPVPVWNEADFNPPTGPAVGTIYVSNTNETWSISGVKYAGDVFKGVDVVEQIIDKLTGPMPNELIALAATIIEDEPDANRIPVITWRNRTNGFYSSGRCSIERIVVTAGSSFIDARKTLIHELAHWLMIGENHSPYFYERLFELYYKYDRVNFDENVKREWRYKPETSKLGYALFMRSSFGKKWPVEQ